MDEKIKRNNFLHSIKQGFIDIKTVVQEGNYKLFVKQFVLVLIVFLGFRYVGNQFVLQEQEINGKIAAIEAQQTNEKEYETNKRLLLSLEPRFANISDKNEWLLSQVIDIFKNANLTPNVAGRQTEDTSNSSIVTTSIQVSSDMDYKTFANLVASIENRSEYIRISNFTIEKAKEGSQIGMNKISLKLNTAFPKEKLSESTMFKKGSAATDTPRARRGGMDRMRRG